MKFIRRWAHVAFVLAVTAGIVGVSALPASAMGSDDTAEVVPPAVIAVTYECANRDPEWDKRTAYVTFHENPGTVQVVSWSVTVLTGVPGTYTTVGGGPISIPTAALAAGTYSWTAEFVTDQNKGGPSSGVFDVVDECADVAVTEPPVPVTPVVGVTYECVTAAVEPAERLGHFVASIDPGSFDILGWSITVEANGSTWTGSADGANQMVLDITTPLVGTYAWTASFTTEPNKGSGQTGTVEVTDECAAVLGDPVVPIITVINGPANVGGDTSGTVDSSVVNAPSTPSLPVTGAGTTILAYAAIIVVSAGLLSVIVAGRRRTMG